MSPPDIEPVTLNQWYPVETCDGLTSDVRSGRLLGTNLTMQRLQDGRPVITVPDSGQTIPVQERYGCVWTTLGSPAPSLPDIPEAEEADRRVVACGSVQVRSSGLRIVENFLDMAHFPFVHTDILGVEPHTEVAQYDTEIRRDVNEVWATKLQVLPAASRRLVHRRRRDELHLSCRRAVRDGAV